MATIACVPTPSAFVVHAAVRLLPLPARLTESHPEIVVPSLVNATGPVGALPFTVAVNVTVFPAMDGFNELTSVVVVGAGAALLTTCDSDGLEDAPFAELPA